jgi:hypothetical protein
MAVLSRSRFVLAFALVMVMIVGAISSALAQEADLGFSPASGHARVVAQGVAALPEGDAVWRTVRTRAPLPAEATFEARPLGFVLATSGPMLLVDEESGEQVHLGLGEAAYVNEGASQQRSSLAAQPVSYLSIELVSVDAPPPADSATVLQPGQPFEAPPGLHDLDLLIDTLSGDEALTIPDSGFKNVILITDGTANVGRPGNAPVALLAGEAATFSGDLEVAAAADAGSATFVVAMIGPELPPVAGAQAEGVEPEVVATASATGRGSISVQVYTCPPGMTVESLNAAACAPADSDFDVTLSGSSLAGPLTIGDAAGSGDAYVWDELPFGQYVIAEAVLPSGYTSYALAAPNATGSAAAGYRVSINESQPDLAVRIYNFTDS